MDVTQEIVNCFELHDVQGINNCFNKGVDPNQIHKGKPLVYELINMYSRGPLFKKCMQVFVHHGLIMHDICLLAVLLDDSEMLKNALRKELIGKEKRYTFDCTFTPLYDVTLLHICAEYGHLECAKVLLDLGMDVNTQAGFDEDGFGGHTPVFHTVNQHANNGMEMLQFLLSKGADISITIQGLIWGKGYPWETYIPSVNPISYAMMGLLRQVQRTEPQIYDVISWLMKARYGIDYSPKNIPNEYLRAK